MSRLAVPPPRAHLAGTLALVERWVGLLGDHPDRPALTAFLDRPEALPARVEPERAGLKYDVYLAAGEAGRAWGVAVSDQHEGLAMEAPARRLCLALGIDPAPVLAFRRALHEPSLVVGLGFDRPDRPARLKLYLQEPRWGQGVGEGPVVAAALAAFGVALPAWARERTVGVVAFSLTAESVACKVYLGGPTPAAAAAGAPVEARQLADRLAAASPLPGGWSYLTLRLGPTVRFALNKIYNPLQTGFAGDRATPARAWEDVRRLFAAAGQAQAFALLRQALPGPEDLVVLPTATALEPDGADLYVAAWATG